jgi:hypothetical protein
MTNTVKEALESSKEDGTKYETGRDQIYGSYRKANYTVTYNY